jgi:hypothetical protein
MMKLIIEQIKDFQCLMEGPADGKKHLYVEGIFLQGNIKNKNGRYYPINILEKEVDRYSKAFLTEGRAYGELGHPEGPRINPDRISHRIVSLEKNTNDYHGKAVIIPEGLGKVVYGVYETGGKLGASSRAMGTLKEDKENGWKVVQEDFLLATAADLVIDPSAPNAFVNGIYEGVDWIWNNGILTPQKVEELKEQTDKAFVSKKDREAKLVSVFEEFINSLSNSKNLEIINN